MLARDFTDGEILNAFSQMDLCKAPGIGGLSSCFFKENWEVVGKGVLKLCHDVLDGNKDISYLNDTMIILIPKTKEPNDMTNFRPISLCRVIDKIISEVLANRLKEALPLCISQNQCAFVPSHIIHDNILIAHELIHYLQSSKNGPNKGFVIKLDMSKAYDRVDRNFLEKVTKKLGFEDTWVDKILRSIRSIRYVVKCNMVLSKIIILERGLRQGDPLSPYLFLFCMEAFSRMLLHAQRTNVIRGIRASQNDPHINHLLFVDDTLLFVRNKKVKLRPFLNILGESAQAWGQSINLDKSMVFF
ncbi:hypothetical protein PVK06_002519 [Gossypium arboreum]|uniref:Reverse transcriptase domain-containing protein n=1 Tax=Gossypium arboreum TaxID=29729 RepID=A0ABR0R4Y1_GOSAR|nr:hypothetical protein PVK06_002519 [Gossypium arboreum]